jgi:hypothetical protein
LDGDVADEEIPDLNEEEEILASLEKKTVERKKKKEAIVKTKKGKKARTKKGKKSRTEKKDLSPEEKEEQARLRSEKRARQQFARQQKKKKMLLLMGGALVVILLSAGLFFYKKNSSSQTVREERYDPAIGFSKLTGKFSDAYAAWERSKKESDTIRLEKAKNCKGIYNEMKKYLVKWSDDLDALGENSEKMTKYLGDQIEPYQEQYRKVKSFIRSRNHP